MDFVIGRKRPCIVEYSEQETDAVKIAAENLKADLRKVFGETILADGENERCARIVIQTVPGSFAHKETYRIEVEEGVLTITGEDRRGTIYGIYELSQNIGVSPWYFWADVPVKKKEAYILPEGYSVTDYPTVEYRGIFINDEEELEVWVQNYLGEETIGVKAYEKIFELLLRLKANYIWPAMHVNSFNVKVENGALAEKMGIVVGTSHCDMLMRSNNREWKPWIAKKGYEGVRYDYSIPGRNREILQEYWRESVEQNSDFEVCYTIGMRGIHDSGFETETLKGLTGDELKQAKIALLQQVMTDQQQILRETLGRETMMTFVPYKEVLPLYDGGLEVPEDITLVWANDNYGHIRRYPSKKEQERKGGNGIYYHNSYWAPPGMSYVFLCSIPLAHTANELRKAYAEGVRKLWVMNVGAMKPLEQEIEFFLRLAWEIDKGNGFTDDVDAYVESWINRNFSGNIGAEVSKLLNDFSQITNVRKPELMDYDAFSQTAYGDEAAVRIHAYEEMFARGNALYEKLPMEEKDAFFQMVLMRIHAAYYTNLAYYYGDRSTLMCKQGKYKAAAEYVEKCRQMEDARRRMVVYYNTIMADGKWNGIVNPEGFPPPRAAMMPVCTPPMGLRAEDDANLSVMKYTGQQQNGRMTAGNLVVTLWNEENALEFNKSAVKWLEIGNGGEAFVEYYVEAPEWVKLSCAEGCVETEMRILVEVVNTYEDRLGEIIVTEKNTGAQIKVPISTKAVPSVAAIWESMGKMEETDIMLQGVINSMHIEDDGMVVVEAESSGSHYFKKIKRLGRGAGNLMESIDSATRGGQGSPLRYKVYFISEGEFTMEIHRFPSLNSTGQIRVGVSVDNGPVMIVGTESNDEHRGNWKENVRNNVDRMYVKLPYLEPGEHSICFYAVDKYFSFSRFVIYTKERKNNNFIGVAGNQALPVAFDSEAFTKGFYGEVALRPRAVEYAYQEHLKGKAIGDTLIVTDVIKQDVTYANTVMPDWYLKKAQQAFAEKQGYVGIDCATALAESENAYTAGDGWRYCGSESFGRSGLAMYIRERGLKWEDCEGAPSLNYKFRCEGGEYTLWLLAKFATREEAYFGVGVDGTVLEQEQIYNKGCLWRYEAEQIYRYVPLTTLNLDEGEHLLTIYARASAMRLDRICLMKGNEMPPMDSEWS